VISLGKFVPDPQIGTLGGTLIWLFAVSLLVIFVFTTGLLPIIIWAVFWGTVLVITYFALSRLLFRLKRGA